MIEFLVIANIYLTVGAIVAGLVAEPEGATDYLCFLLVWPYALISGITHTLWKMLIVRVP